ncbi:microtubule-associated protein 10-like [Hoplias malabaricus]|uniref:microtubule-associated protein 10-like n=1 Tax=Hoplias malabaricus TaxID=27720 RepID=UPI00346254C7
MDLNTNDTENESDSSANVSAYEIQESRNTGESHVFSNAEKHQSQNVPCVLTVAQLPLLSALLVELSHLHGQMQHQQRPPSIHPHQVNLYKSEQEHTPTPASEKWPQTKNVKAAESPYQGSVQPSIPGHRHCKPLKSHLFSPKIQHTVAESTQRRSHPKRKLRYGLTHGFHLRLKQIKPGRTRHHECVETFMTKPAEPQTKISSKLKQDKLLRQVFNRDLDGTLLHSLETNHATSDIRLSHSQKNPCKNLTKQIKLPVVKDCHDTADKEVQVNVPSTLGQNMDHKAHELECKHQMNPSHLIQNSSNLQWSFKSNVRTVRPCSPSHSSVSIHNSPQPDEYQDVFTSLDTTDGSPDPLCSLKPCTVQRTGASSGNISSDSSKPHPVPYKTQTSLKRSLNMIHVVKPHLQNVTCSTSSDDSKSGVSRGSVCRQRNSESCGGSLKSPAMCLVLTTLQSSEVNGSAPTGKLPADKCQLSDDSILESLSSTDSEEERNELGSLGFLKKCQPISELVVNKLPGYTL